MRAEDCFRKGCWGSVGFELWDVNREQASQDGWSVWPEGVVVVNVIIATTHSLALTIRLLHQRRDHDRSCNSCYCSSQLVSGLSSLS